MGSIKCPSSREMITKCAFVQFIRGPIRITASNMLTHRKLCRRQDWKAMYAWHGRVHSTTKRLFKSPWISWSLIFLCIRLDGWHFLRCVHVTRNCDWCMYIHCKNRGVEETTNLLSLKYTFYTFFSRHLPSLNLQSVVSRVKTYALKKNQL